MKRLAALALVLALVAVACGDDDTGSSDTAAVTTATPAATTATTAAATTTAAPATTAAPEAGNPLVEAALALEGTHTGTWNNTTFGSTGAIEMTIEVDEAAETATVTIDLGGSVFGGGDPDPIEYADWDLSIGSPDIDAYEFPWEDDLLGEWEIRFEGDQFRLVAPAVPGVGGLELTIEGQFTQAGLEGTYTIEGLAEGTIEVVAGS